MKNIQRKKLVSTNKIFENLKPKYFMRSITNLSNLTPEEIETLIIIKNVII